MRTGNYFLENDDLMLSFDRLVDWEPLVRLVEGEGAPAAEAVSSWRDALVLAGRYVGTEVSGRAAAVDALGVERADGRIEMNEPIRQNLRGLAELGLIGLSLPAAYGGAGLPFTVTAMFVEMLARACPSTSVQYAFYTAPAALILSFGTEEQKRRFLPRLARGEVIGAIAMTEPQAGSDVGLVATTATREGGGWRLRGRKQFISAGNGDLVIVLARCVAGSRGLEGLGLFIAERADGNYAVERAEHKITIRGSPTCALSFDGTRAEILGAPGEGWREILTFMNGSRIGVGIQGLGIAQAALEAARDHAAQRVQLGRPIREHPMIAEMLVDMETTVAGLRALSLEAAVRQDLAVLGADESAARELRELTPLVKWYGSEQAVRIARIALQIHGGYGVVTEYDVERFFRDSLILPIYEGTSQIQALMAVRDLVKAVVRRPVALLGRGPSRLLASLPPRAPGDLVAARDVFVGTLRTLLARVARTAGPRLLRRAALGDAELGPVLLHAERLTETLAHLHAARALAAQAARSPERAPIAARAARTARLVAMRNADALRGDSAVFARIADWRRERERGGAG